MLWEDCVSTYLYACFSYEPEYVYVPCYVLSVFCACAWFMKEFLYLQVKSMYFLFFAHIYTFVCVCVCVCVLRSMYWTVFVDVDM